MKAISFIIVFSVLITGCSSYGPVAVDPIDIPTHFKESLSFNNTHLKNNWWENFNDKQLNELVELALANNIDYKMALNNINIAKPYASTGQVEIIEAKSRMAKLALISEVVNLYFQIATVNKNIINTTQQLDIMNSLVKIAKTQYDLGEIDNTNLNEMKVKETIIKNDLKNLKKQQKIYMNMLAQLVGQYPEDFTIHIHPIRAETHFTKLIAARTPAEVVANRPDIQVAYLEARYENTKTKHEQAELNYKNTVLKAFQDVDDALLSFKEDQEALLVEKSNMKNVSIDYNAARIQYKAGEIDYATSASFELRMLQSEYALTNLNLLLYKDIIHIYKALGMGVKTDANNLS